MAKHTNLIWGSTGAGKTVQLMSFAKGMWEATGKRTRLVSAEKAQSEGIFREGIEAGYIIPWWLDDRRGAQGDVETPFERMTDAMLGKWPLDVTNPFSVLVPAFTIQYKAMCRASDRQPASEQAHAADKSDLLVYQGDKATTQASQLVCPKCKRAVTQETVRVITDKRLSEIGAYFFEGLTEFGAMMMANMALRSAKGEAVGGDIPVKFTDGTMVIGSPTRGHYGTSQSQLANRVRESKHLPVDYVWWTAGREDGKDDDKGGVLVFGPKLPGHAATADVPRWFGTTLSTCAVPVQKDGKQATEYRLYLQKYYQDWIQMIAKVENVVNNRIPPERLKGIPQYVVVDHEQESITVAGVKMKPPTLLWEITQLIEQRQSPISKPSAAPASNDSQADKTKRG